MDWLRQAAAALREGLTQQSWLDGWQSSIANTPDWALLAAGPATLLLFALLLRITWPRSRQSPRAKRPRDAERARQPRLEPASVACEAEASTASVPRGERSFTPRASTTDDDRSVRVFVSSTFLDMQADRDELVKKTFPALRAKYRSRGVEVFEVDLRWGITREQQERGETLPTLLAEIDRCRPYFIGLLGDRYGWIPPSEALTDKLLADYPALADARGSSVTAMEIIHGVLSSPDTPSRSFFFERDPSWEWIATLNEMDRPYATPEPEEIREKLEELKAEVRRKAKVDRYARPDEISRKVFDALDQLLDERFPETGASDAFEQVARLHSAYARERRALHIGSKGYIRDLNGWMEAKDAAPMLITGASGGGKSTLIANWIHAYRSAHPQDVIVEHYLGASPNSADPKLIMRRLWECLNRATSQAVSLPETDSGLMEMSVALRARIARAHQDAERASARVLLALDGLDKLSAEQDLRWLPIVPGVHLLTSSLAGQARSA
ncbi:MAG: DUF4062 domain-containing protein, partial [Hyphomonadaceae bacterium]